METRSSNKLEKEKNESTVDYLKRLKGMGYLFHGSADPEVIGKLEPRKASDPANEWNADIAVYATSEPVWSTIFALYRGKETWATNTRANETGIIEMVARIPARYKESLSNEVGRVYVLPRTSFETRHEYDIQFKSREEVVPITSVEVNLKDYYEMGGKIVWS